MTSSFFVLLHGSPVLETTLLEYLYRVLAHLLAFGGVAVLIFRSLDVVSALRSAFAPRHRSRESDARDR